MIAPIRPRPAESRSESLSPARRAVAEVLFSRPAAGRGAPRVSPLATGFFLAWLLGVAASYLLLQSWWTLRRP